MHLSREAAGGDIDLGQGHVSKEAEAKAVQQVTSWPVCLVVVAFSGRTHDWKFCQPCQKIPEWSNKTAQNVALAVHGIRGAL